MIIVPLAQPMCRALPMLLADDQGHNKRENCRNPRSLKYTMLLDLAYEIRLLKTINEPLTRHLIRFRVELCKKSPCYVCSVIFIMCKW